MTFADLQSVCHLSFTDAPEDDLAIWVGVISLHLKHLLLPQGFESPVGIYMRRFVEYTSNRHNISVALDPHWMLK